MSEKDSTPQTDQEPEDDDLNRRLMVASQDTLLQTLFRRYGTMSEKHVHQETNRDLGDHLSSRDSLIPEDWEPTPETKKSSKWANKSPQHLGQPSCRNYLVSSSQPKTQKRKMIPLVVTESGLLMDICLSQNIHSVYIFDQARRGKWALAYPEYGSAEVDGRIHRRLSQRLSQTCVILPMSF